MIKIKTANNTLTDIGEVYVKTSPTTLAKIAEGYQVVSVNGAKRLIPVFLSECKHNYVISDELSYGASCTEDGLNVYVCTKCGERYSETGESAYGHNYVDGVCTSCEDCLYHGEETAFTKYDHLKHVVTCSCCGRELRFEGHSVDHYKYVGESTRVPVCVCGFEFDPEPYEPEPHEHNWDANTGTCSCGESCDHPEVDEGYCTTCGYCVWA